MKDFFRFRSELLEGKKDQNQTNEASTKELKDLDLGDDVMVNGKMGMFYGMQGSKVKVRFPSGQETVPAKDVEVMNLMMDDLDKDDDDPCWDGYVQVGTKMKNGKEVPNCVPMEEARKQMKNESAASYERHHLMELTMSQYYIGVGSRSARKAKSIAQDFKSEGGKFLPDGNRNFVLSNKADAQKLLYMFMMDNIEIDSVTEIATDHNNDRTTRKLDPDKFLALENRMMNEAKVTDDHWAIVKRNGSFYSGKSEILKIVKPDLRGNPPSMKMINTYGGDSAVKVGELKKALKGKRNTDKLMKQLGESKKQLGGSVLNERLDDKYFVVKKERGKTLYFYIRGLAGTPDWTENAEFAYVLPDEKYAKDVARQFGGEVQKGLHEANESYYDLLEETKPKSGDREAYKKFFNKALKKFGADSLADLDDDKQKEFFNYVDKNWESEDEKTVTEATAEITRFGSDKEKSDVMSLAKKMGLKVKDTGDGIELSGNMKKISDVTTTAQKRGAKIEESRRISSRDDAHKEIEKMMGRGREVQEVGEYVYMTLKMGGRIDIEKMKRSAAKMKRNAPEIIDTMISMGLIETIGGKIVNIHPQYHVHEST